jgi:hypothetical protein
MAAVSVPSWDTGYENAEAVVANRALVRIGADVIRSDTEDTPAIRQVKIAFAATRDELLRDEVFNFANRLLTLAVVADKTILLVNTTINLTLVTRTWASIGTHTNTTLDGFSGLTVNALAGVKVSGTGIPAGAYIVSNTATEAILSAAATGTASITLTGELDGSSLVGWGVSGTGIPSGTFIVSSTGAGAVMSQAATASGAVTVTASLGVGRWAYAYALPSSPVILKILEIDGNQGNDFEILGASTERRILCDMESDTGLLDVKVVEQVIDPSRWDPLFMDAFVLRLASKLCVPLGKASLLQIIQQEFMGIYNLAKKSTIQETNTDNGVEPWTTRAAQ